MNRDSTFTATTLLVGVFLLVLLTTPMDCIQAKGFYEPFGECGHKISKLSGGGSEQWYRCCDFQLFSGTSDTVRYRLYGLWNYPRLSREVRLQLFRARCCDSRSGFRSLL